MPSNNIKYNPAYITIIFLRISGLFTITIIYIWLPLIQYLLMRIYSCEGYDTCSNTIAIIWIVCAGLTQLILFIITGIIIIVVNTNNPESRFFWSSYNGITHALRLTLQQSIGIVLDLGIRWDILNVFCIIITRLAGITLILRWNKGGEHTQWKNTIFAFEEFFTFISHFIILLMPFIGKAEESFYIAVSLSFCLTFIYEVLRKENIIKILLKLLISQTTVNNVEICIYNFIAQVRDPIDNENYKRMNNILLAHKRSCDDLSCVCSNLLEFMDANYMLKTNKDDEYRISDTNYGREQLFKANFRKIENDWSRFFIKLVRDSLLRLQRSAELHLQLSYLYLGLLKNTYLAFFNAKIAYSGKPSSFLHFNIYIQIRAI